MESQDWVSELEFINARELLGFGGLLHHRPEQLQGRNGTTELAERLLWVRTRSGKCEALRANSVQRAFESQRGRRNIVLKARQMGLTTWAAARFFLKTITHPGTLTLQVAHTQESAEEIFRIVRRFHDYLPVRLRKGCLKTSRANVRQITFPFFDSQYRVVSAGDPAPRIFQLGMPGSLTQQYIAVKFGGVVVKGANYAHYQVLVDR